MKCGWIWVRNSLSLHTQAGFGALVAVCWEEVLLKGLKRAREASFPGCTQLVRKCCLPGFKYFLSGWKAKASNEGNETLFCF